MKTTLLLILATTLSASAGNISDSKILNYFCEIVIETEFSSDREVHKWTKDINIHKSGTWPDYMSDELDSIIAELNKLIIQPEISLVKSKTEANYIIFLGDADDYAELEPRAKKRIDDNWGLFFINWNKYREITKGTMYVDMERASRELQMHLLREELTQSLGLMNDSERYEDSMFFQRYSETLDYSELDTFLIRLLYMPEVKAGMKKSAARKLIKNESLIDQLR